VALEGIAAIQARIREITGARGDTAMPPATPVPAPAGDFATLLAGAATQTSGLPGGAWSAMRGQVSGTAQQFLTTALAQKGKPYIYAAHTQPSDPDPPAFDCSELTKWAAARVGVTIPDGATAQYLHVREHGTTMSVEEALRTPGALLFHFSHEPRDLGDIPADGHVAISVGDGVHTIEARGSKYGTDVFELTSTRKDWFNFAGMIPGM
jgi:cell wall-associated NlpC family hydrolase